MKLLIPLYVHQDEWAGSHPFDIWGTDNAPRCHIPKLLGPAAPTTLSEVLPSLYLSSASFSALSMTRCSALVFTNAPDHTWFVIDAPGLATGRLTLVEFGCNGHVCISTLRRPWNMGQTMVVDQILGRFFGEIADSGIGCPPQYNDPYVPALFSSSNQH